MASKGECYKSNGGLTITGRPYWTTVPDDPTKTKAYGEWTDQDILNQLGIGFLIQLGIGFLNQVGMGLLILDRLYFVFVFIHLYLSLYVGIIYKP